MSLLIGALTLGMILSIMAIGVFISFRIHDFPDITLEGSFVVGAAVATVLIAKGVNPLLASLIASLVGALAGMVTGILHTLFKFNGLLSGILVMTGLYSINLRIMGRSNIPFKQTYNTLFTYVDSAFSTVLGKDISTVFHCLGHEIPLTDVAGLLGTSLIVVIVILKIFMFYKTNFGTAMRATGDNEQMVRALGISSGRMLTLGLMLSNALIAFSGALFAQYQTFADVQMGMGMLVWGLASVIIGESLVRTTSIGYGLIGCVMGAVLFRLLVAIALQIGLNPNDLKLITAVFVFIALALPSVLPYIKRISVFAKLFGGNKHA